MRIKNNKKIEFFFKNIFFSKPYLLRKRAKRFLKKQTEVEICHLNKLIDSSRASIDIGVYRGVYSYFLTSLCSFVYAFEANPLLFSELKKGFKNYKNIKLENLAVSSESGTANLKVPFRNQESNNHDIEELYQLGIATIHDENRLDGYSFDTFNIKKTKLDNYNFSHKIGFIKIDVEGHEHDIILGATNILKQFKPTLLVEIEERYTQRKNIETIDLIKSHDYNCYTMQRDGKLTLVDEKNIKYIKNNNFIFK